MNKLRKLSLTIISALLLLPALNAQNLVHTGFNIADQILVKQRDSRPRILIEDILGTQYDNDSFQLGKVYTTKTVFENIPLKYNIHEDVVEFKDKGQVFLLDPAVTIKKIQIGNRNLVVEPYNDGSKLKLGYFTILDSGYVKLLMKQIVNYEEQKQAKALESSNKPAQFVRMPDVFYLRVGTIEAKPIYNVKKAVLEFPEHQKSLASFVSRRKIGANMEDLISLWQYYHTLDQRAN